MKLQSSTQGDLLGVLGHGGHAHVSPNSCTHLTQPGVREVTSHRLQFAGMCAWTRAALVPGDEEG